MKKIKIALCALLLGLAGTVFAQTGVSCAEAKLLALDSGCTENDSTTAMEVWYSFVASGTDFNIDVANCGSPGTRYMARFDAYYGGCTALSLMGSDSIIFSSDTIMRIRLNGLIVGDTYYFKVSRTPQAVPCRTCIEPLAVYKFCVVPVGLRPSITIFTPDGGYFQCAYPHENCGPAPMPTCSLTACVGEMFNFCTYSTGLPTMPFDFYTNNTLCNGSGGSITWNFQGSTTPIQVNTQANSPQNVEICHNNIFWNAPGNYVISINFVSTCTDCGQNYGVDGSYEWLIPITITGPSIVATSTMVSCFGGSDGTASVPYDPNVASYLWQPTGQTTSTATGLTAGTYTVQMFGDPTACQPTQTVVVSEPPLLVVATTSVAEHCVQADDGTATAALDGGTAPYYYLWSTTPVQTNATAIGLSAGTYTVTVTDANGCTASAVTTVPVSALPQVPIITNNSITGNLCGSLTITYIVTNYNSTFNYTTTFSTPPSSVTEPVSGTYIVTWPSAANDVTITVTVNNGNPICTTSTSVTIPRCCIVTGPNLDNLDGTTAQDDVTDLATLFPTHTNVLGTIYTYNNPTGALYINGTFSVPTGTTLRIVNTEVRFGGNAKIDLQGTAQLIVSGSHLHAGCNFMWDGMYVNTNGQITVNNGSLIEDAMQAIVSINGGPYTIHNAIFNKNRIAIDVRAFSGNHAGTIRNTVITCRNLPSNVTLATTKGNQTTAFIQVFVVANNYTAATLLPPYSGKRSYAGITITDVGVTAINSNQVATYTFISVGVGSTYALENVFDNMDYGVHATRSNVRVDNNAFQYMTGGTTITKAGDPEIGIGIYGISDGHTGFERVMVIGNPLSGPRNSFYDCNRGIDLNAYYKININKNRFQSNQIYTPIVSTTLSTIGNYAVFVKTGRYINVDILNNDIVNWNIGIAMFGDVVVISPTQQLKFFGDARINDNRVCPTVTDFGVIGSQGVRQGIIAQNIIPSCAPSCLNQSAIGRLYINDNNLNNVFNGISVTGWLRRPQIASTLSNPLGQRIYLRYQAPQSFSLFPQSAIRSVNCDAPVIYYNHIDGATQNLTKTLIRGIYVTRSNSSNVKCNDIRNVGQCMVFEGTNASSTVFNNFMYDSQDGLVLLNNGKIGPQGSPPIPNILPNGISSDNRWIGPFSHAATFTNNTFSANSHSRIYYRFNNIVEHPTGGLNLTTGNPSTDTYNAVGGFTQVPVLAQGTNCSLPPALAQLGTGTPNQRQAIQDIVLDSTSTDSAGIWLARQQVYFMLRKDPSWMNNSPVLQQFYLNAQPVSIGIVDSVDVELSANNPVNAVSVNATIVPLTQMELNHQTFNDIYATLMSGDSATVQQIAVLEGIAGQCPLNGGNAVYRARTLLCLIEDEVLFFEDSCTVPSGARMLQQTVQVPETNSTLSNCEVFPNPNDGLMVLTYSVQEGQAGSFAIFDMTGRAVTQFILPSGQATLNIDQTTLSAGMYYYAFYIEGSLVKSEKIIISK